MMKKDFFGESIPKIEAILGYSFRDKSLLRQAFTRSSWCNERQDRMKIHMNTFFIGY